MRELSADDLRDTYLTRLELESLAVRRTAGRFTDVDGKSAGQALEEHVRHSLAGNQAAAREAHTEFHFTLYRAGGSRSLPRAIEPVWQNSERYGPQQRREHQAILDACAAHDADAADAALRVHLEGAMDRILRTMTGEADQQEL